MEKRQIALLGSTGSIGTQALDVIRRHPGRLEVYALTAHTQVDLLIRQAREWLPEVVVIADPSKYEPLQAALQDLPIKVWAGSEALAQVVELEPIDMVLTAMVGFAGLQPTIHALKAGKAIALANKETLVVAGELITRLAAEHRAPILPVDSEHSAIFQCLAGEQRNPIEKILLTASGGPFRLLTAEQLQRVTKADALKHPNWNMGAKVTIDSASLMNKGLEMIEARWLFGVRPEQIQVLVHPQSIIHSMVQFGDKSIKAQLGLPDMRLPIQYALTYPDRLETDFPSLDFAQYPTLTFEEPDLARFPHLSYAFEAIRQGGNLPCILNAANEVIVAAFLRDEIGFSAMSALLEKALQSVEAIAAPSYDDLVESDKKTRIKTSEIINNVWKHLC
jgi:1-deoxy-D-xylulose-5-phosphate reductoisomerase